MRLISLCAKSNFLPLHNIFAHWRWHVPSLGPGLRMSNFHPNLRKTPVPGLPESRRDNVENRRSRKAFRSSSSWRHGERVSWLEGSKGISAFKNAIKVAIDVQVRGSIAYAFPKLLASRNVRRCMYIWIRSMLSCTLGSSSYYVTGKHRALEQSKATGSRRAIWIVVK